MRSLFDVLSVYIEVEFTSCQEVFAKLLFEEVLCSKTDLLNLFLGRRMKVDNRDASHAIVVEESVDVILEKGNLLHIRDLVYDVANLKRKLKARSNLCKDQNVSGGTAEREDIAPTVDVQGEEAEVVHIGEPLLSGSKRHVHRVNLDSF